MKNNHFWLVAVILSLGLLTVSCNKKENIKVGKTELNYAPIGGGDIIPIEADCQWYVDYDNVDWIDFTPKSGTNNGAVIVTVAKNNTYDERTANINIVSESGKVRETIKISQGKYEIVDIHNKFWFLYEYERWATDYQNDYIPDSYEHWDYYAEAEYDNWFFYFLDDNTGYQMHTKNYDTVYYAYDYVYYPFGDSLYIRFESDSTTTEIEDYHATIHNLTQDRFQFSDEFSPHQFENLFLANVTRQRGEFKINPKKVMKKERGPIIQVEK